MLVASVHIPEFVEFFTWLVGLRYDGWIGFDIYPYRENTEDIVRQSIAWTRKLRQAGMDLDKDDVLARVRRGDSLAAAKAIYRRFV